MKALWLKARTHISAWFQSAGFPYIAFPWSLFLFFQVTASQPWLHLGTTWRALKNTDVWVSCPGILKLLVWLWSGYRNFYKFPRRSYCPVKVRSYSSWGFKGGEFAPDVSNCHIQESCPFSEQWLPDLSILRNLLEGFRNTNCLAPTPEFLILCMWSGIWKCVSWQVPGWSQCCWPEDQTLRTTALEADKAMLENVQTLGFSAQCGNQHNSGAFLIKKHHSVLVHPCLTLVKGSLGLVPFMGQCQNLRNAEDDPCIEHMALSEQGCSLRHTNQPVDSTLPRPSWDLGL